MTIAGNHTLGELRDLLAARDYAFAQIQSAIAAKPPNDPPWSSDWQAFASRWTSYRASVADFVSSWHLLGDDTVVQSSSSQDLPDSAPTPSGPFTDWWHETLYQGYPMQDLYRRLTLLPGWSNAAIDFSATPQPTAPDADLNALNTLPNVAGGASKASASALLLGGCVLLGGLGVVLLKRIL